MEHTCPSCGTSNPEAARFCMACGSALEAPQGEEVRQVTILFADLVGFTQRSDRADPEDVRRTLVPFHRAAKAAIEEHGGTLDKFIGDAAMGVFGAPVAHEDDPARAVRAGLALLDRVEQIRRTVDADANIRVAVATGDAVVAFGAGPQVGEAVAGDVVNTASRMQSLAPPGGIVVGERTWEAVRLVFDGEALDAVPVKGKAEPLRCWRITGTHAGGALELPMLGRDDDLAWLLITLGGVRERQEPAAVTLVAPPGLGKTRLLAEFERRVAEDPAVLLFRIAFEPRGHDSTVGPLADLVADAAGFDRAADPAAVERGLDEAVARLAIDDDDRTSLGRRLRVVIGAMGAAGAAEGPMDIADALARTMGRAAGVPTLLTVEDLHWADPAASRVLEALAGAFDDAPFLLVSTARPEIVTSGHPIGTTRDLQPLSREATRELLELASARDLDTDDALRIADRADGNPLFAIEFGRTLGEPGAGEAVPTSIRAVVAARLDALPAAARSVAVDAAVVGSTFWSGAIAALDTGRDSDAALDELLPRRLIRPKIASRLPGQRAFGFTHALIRDEAYGRLTRAGRARRHLEVGDWLASAAGDAAPSFAASLAHHFGEAVDAATSAGESAIAEAARPRAIHWLVTAAEQVFRLDGDGAYAMFVRALDLGATGELAERALYGSGIVGRRIGRLPAPEVLGLYRRALRSAHDRGDVQAEGMLKVRVGSQLAAMGESEDALASFHDAIAMLEPLPPGKPLAAALTYLAEEEMFAGRSSESLVLVERALPIARDAGAEEDLLIMGLHLRGDARCSIGDLGGVDDLEEALRIARRTSGAAEIVTSLAYVGDWSWQLHGPAAGRAVFEEGVALSARTGVANQGMWARTHLTLVCMELGDWEKVLSLTDDLLSIGSDKLDTSLGVIARAYRALVLLRRHGGATAEDPDKIVTLAEGTRELQSQAPALGYAIEHAAATDDPDTAISTIARLDELTVDTIPVYRAGESTVVARCAMWAGRIDVARRFVEPLHDLPTMRERLYTDAALAVLEEADGDPEAALAAYTEVAERWRAYEHPWEEAHAELGAARVATRLGRPADAHQVRANEIFSSLGIS